MSKEAKNAVNEVLAAAAMAARAGHAAAKEAETEVVRFGTGDRSIEFNIDITAETVWATQQQLADLFERDKRTINEHIKNVFDDKELEEEAVVRKFRTTGSDGKTYEVLHYNLDMILSVGYRVSSAKATRFRQWATRTLTAYLVDGYVLNEARLREDVVATNRLAATLRAIRADEKNIYASVRHFFKEASTDYESNSPACRAFFALLQDKFHYAVTGKTSSQLILDRADHKESNMGLRTFEGNMPTPDEIRIGKNYLDGDELYTLHILCEQFLLYVQSKAMRGKIMTMDGLSKKFDELLRVNDYPVFAGYKDYLKDRAVRHATAEYARFLMRLKKDDVKRITKPLPAS